MQPLSPAPASSARQLLIPWRTYAGGPEPLRTLEGAGGLDPLPGLAGAGGLGGLDPLLGLDGPDPLCGAGGAGLMSRISEAAASVTAPPSSV